MEDSKKNNLTSILLSVFLVITIVSCVLLWIGMNKAEKLAAEYKSAYEELIEENRRAEQAAEEAKAQEEQAAREKQEKSKQYEDKLVELSGLMLSGAAKSEECANLVQDVWNNSIYKIKDDDTDAYTLTASGAFLDDFNDALDNLYQDDAFMIKLRSIKDNQDSVVELMRDLKDPPEEWQNAYSDMLLLYDVYYDFTQLVLRPDCSLKEFRELFEEYDKEAVKRYDKMKIYLN